MKRGDAQSTFSFLLKQSFYPIQDVFHLLILQSLTAARTLAYEIGIKGLSPKHLSADFDLAKTPAFSISKMPVWPGFQVIVTSSLSPKLFRFFMHVNTVLDVILFWIASIAV